LGRGARACLVAGIADTHPSRVTAEDLRDDLPLIIQEGLAPVALRLASTLPGIDQAARSQLHIATFEVHLRAMAAARAAKRILTTLHDHRLTAVVIKGPAIARFHPEGWDRGYTDIDLLVGGADFDAVIDHCRDLDFTEPASTPPWPWMDGLVKEGVNLHSPDGGNIDVHHHVPPWVFGVKVTAATMASRATMGDVGGAPVLFASAEDSVLVAALHVLNDLWKGKIGLVSWRDIIVLLRRLGPDQAEQVFAAAGLRWLLGLLTQSLAACVPEAGIGPAGSRRVPLAMRGRVTALGWNNDSSLSRSRVSFVARLPLLRAVAFVGGCVVPQPRYVRRYYRTYRTYWRQMVGETVSTAQGEDHRMRSVTLTEVEGFRERRANRPGAPSDERKGQDPPGPLLP
jgi:hypothetical protein